MVGVIRDELETALALLNLLCGLSVANWSVTRGLNWELNNQYEVKSDFSGSRNLLDSFFPIPGNTLQLLKEKGLELHGVLVPDTYNRVCKGCWGEHLFTSGI